MVCILKETFLVAEIFKRILYPLDQPVLGCANPIALMA